jgi:hypothetical protein
MQKSHGTARSHDGRQTCGRLLRIGSCKLAGKLDETLKQSVHPHLACEDRPIDGINEQLARPSLDMPGISRTERFPKVARPGAGNLYAQINDLLGVCPDLPRRVLLHCQFQHP